MIHENWQHLHPKDPARQVAIECIRFGLEHHPETMSYHLITPSTWFELLIDDRCIIVGQASLVQIVAEISEARRAQPDAVHAAEAIIREHQHR